MTEQVNLTSSNAEIAHARDTAVEPGSIVARLREQAKHQQETKRLDIKVGGEFGDSLWIRYKPLPTSEMDKFVGQRMGVADNDQLFTSSMDVMARCCEAIVARYDDEDTVLSDADGPVRLEHRLAVLLDMPRAEGVKLTSHEVIILLFGNNGPLLAEHGSTLMTWMTGKEVEPQLGEA
jgi:hypothetical protein